jgi:hypothetical protein
MQTPDRHNNQEDEALQAPPKLVAALKQLQREPLFIPKTTDEAVLRAARQHLGARQSRKAVLFGIWKPWLAAATVAVLLLAVMPQFLRHFPSQGNQARSAREDVNHDGRVDILDAFALASQIKAGRLPTLQMDLNGDGVVDERDVATIAARAVRLEKGS